MTLKNAFTLQVLLVAIVLAWPWSQVGTAQPSSNVLHVDVFDGRPLAAAIQELQKRHGWIITYEDPPYEWAGDSKDHAVASRLGAKPERKALSPIQRAFAMSYTQAEASRPEELLSSMLVLYDESGKTDAFRLLRQGRVYHVIPTRSANSKGIQTPRQSLLETRVTIEEGERSVLDEVRLVLAAVSKATGVYVFLGSGYDRRLYVRTVHRRAVKEGARDLITRTLNATGRDFSWRLLCTPGYPRQDCALNIHLVQPPR